MTCSKCGKEVRSVVHCDGITCFDCCKKCFFHKEIISSISCLKPIYEGQLIRTINVKKGRIIVKRNIIIISPNGRMRIHKSESPELIARDIREAIGGEGKECRSVLHPDAVIITAKNSRSALNYRANAVVSEAPKEPLKGTAVICLKDGEYVTGITQAAAELIMRTIEDIC